MITEIKKTNQGLTFHYKIWEVQENKTNRNKIEEMMETKGIDYFSTARPGRRGGGSAITVNNEQYDMKEVVLNNHNNIEVTFAIVRPKLKEASNIEIIACSVYSVPQSKKKSQLIQFITENYNCLKIKFPSAYFVCGGDINDLKIHYLLNITSDFRQLVTKSTRQGKILSVIVTDLHQHYQELTIFTPVEPDIPGQGKPTDHSTPLATPLSDTSQTKKNYRLCTTRPLPDSRVRQFGNWIVGETFQNVNLADNPSDKVDEFNSLVNDKLDEFCPKKIIKRIYKVDQQSYSNTQEAKGKGVQETKEITTIPPAPPAVPPIEAPELQEIHPKQDRIHKIY